MTPMSHPYDPKWHGPWLLGIDWVHINSFEPVLADKSDRAVKRPDHWVKSHSGMAGVIPASRLAALLDAEELKIGRKRDDDRITEEKNKGQR